VVVFYMLDCIAWDVIYTADDSVGDTWRFIARHADGLAYLSAFTQDRFNQRFPVATAVNERVVYLSFNADELTLPICRGIEPSSHVLLVGNSYDHKDLGPTLQLLLDAFPLQQIVVFGGDRAPLPHVRVIPSGQASHEEVHRLIATARAIVYPSFYEGFGLPVVEGLAYGRPVLVRKSPLWKEIAAHSCFAGSLVEFEDAVSLVDGLGRVLHDLPLMAIRAGAAIPEGATPYGFRDCARRTIELVEQCLVNIDVRRWLNRDEVLQALVP
jgi:glycosyltransferase involved in cell wall biosynthesis